MSESRHGSPQAQCGTGAGDDTNFFIRAYSMSARTRSARCFFESSGTMETKMNSYAQSIPAEAVAVRKQSHIRYTIIALLFVVGSINYADRAIFSIAGPKMMEALGLKISHLGYLMATFGWAYVIGQLPGGWLLDRFGAKRVYIGSFLLWSVCTVLIGFAGFLGGIAIPTIFLLVFLLSLCESPSFPSNARIVSSWFPSKERGTAAAIFTAAQYFALVLFLPIMSWISQNVGWQAVYWFMGVVGIVLAAIVPFVLYSPKQHPRVSPEELEYISNGGALVEDSGSRTNTASAKNSVGYLKQLLSNRLILGIMLGQFCVNVLIWFFTTWFPIYLAQARQLPLVKVGFLAAVPAIAGFLGGIAGGVLSDYLLRKQYSLTVARKVPIVVGMLLAMAILGCIFADTTWGVVAFLSIAFFGKGVGAQGWAVVTDSAPKEAVGLCSSLCNIAGNAAGIVTPIVIGYIVSTTGSFNGALVFVALSAVGAILSFVFLAGKIERVQLKPAE
jgi:ACS family glucarate transporter-like MFS transporter